MKPHKVKNKRFKISKKGIDHSFQGKTKSEPNKSSPVIIEKISKYIGTHSVLLFVTLLALLLGYVFFDFIIFKKIYMFKGIGSDTINIFYPDLYHLAEYIRAEGLPKWSHSQGMGQNIFPFSFGAPFNLLMILSGTKLLPFFIGYSEVLKILISGLFFYLFLRIIPLSKYSSFIGGLLYAFSGFIIVGSSWYVFSSEGYQIALLLLAFELLYKRGSWYLFPIPIAIIGAFEPFNLYLYGLMLIVYMLLRIIGEHGLNLKIIAPLAIKIAGLSILGLLLSSTVLLPNVREVINSPRISGNYSYSPLLMSISVFELISKEGFGTFIMRLFSNDILGSGIDFKGVRNYLEAPLVYCSSFSLVLFTQVFSFLTRRAKIVYILLLLIVIAPFIFPYLRYAVWLFAGDYHRGFSLFLSFLLIFYALKSLDYIYQVPKINIPVLVTTVFALLYLLHYRYFPNNDYVINFRQKSIISFFILVYAFFIFLLRYPKIRNYVRPLLLLILLIELMYMNNITVNQREAITTEEFTQKTGYNDYTVDAVKYIKSIDNSAFRIHKNYTSGLSMHASLNDAKVQGYYSTSSYDSYNQKYYIRFLQQTGVIGLNEGDTRWCLGLNEHILLRTWASSKYYLVKGTLPETIQQSFLNLGSFGDVRVFKNKWALPFGFTYDKYMPLSDFSRLSQFKKEVTILSLFVCEDDDLDEFTTLRRIALEDTLKGDYYYETLANDLTQLRKDTLNIKEFGHNLIKGSITLNSDKLLFFSIPYDKGWTAKIDGEIIKPLLINIGFMGFVLNTGSHTVELSFFPPLLKTGFILTCIGVFIYLILAIYSLYYLKKSRQL